MSALHCLRLATVLTVCGIAATSSSQNTDPAKSSSAFQPSRLLNQVWRVTAPDEGPLGALYIFMSNGTLLQTSCVEVYRLSTWRSDSPGKLTIVEDGRPIEGQIEQNGRDGLRLRFKLGGSWDRWRSLSVAKAPFVCPDLRR